MRGGVEIPFTIERLDVQAEARASGALVLTPTTPTVFGPAQRERLRGVPPLSAVEEALIERVEARAPDTPIVILRGADDEGRRLWSFDLGFDDAELAEAGRIFTRAVIPLYREFAKRGVVLFVHSDWGHREIPPIRRGLGTLADRIRASDEDDGLDEWVIRNMLLYSSLPLRHVLERLLPTHLGLLHRREERVRRLVERYDDAV